MGIWWMTIQPVWTEWFVWTIESSASVDKSFIKLPSLLMPTGTLSHQMLSDRETFIFGCCQRCGSYVFSLEMFRVCLSWATFLKLTCGSILHDIHCDLLVFPLQQDKWDNVWHFHWNYLFIYSKKPPKSEGGSGSVQFLRRMHRHYRHVPKTGMITAKVLCNSKTGPHSWLETRSMCRAYIGIIFYWETEEFSWIFI